MNGELWFVLGLMTFFISIVLFFRGKCPECGRLRSFKKTGEKRREGNVIFGKTFEEHRCTKCAHTAWVERRVSEGGDGGG